jgi:hypothetical protein
MAGRLPRTLEKGGLYRRATEVGILSVPRFDMSHCIRLGNGHRRLIRTVLGGADVRAD